MSRCITCIVSTIIIVIINIIIIIVIVLSVHRLDPLSCSSSKLSADIVIHTHSIW